MDADLDRRDVPILITFLFGDKAHLAMWEADARLLCWCKAFDDWLDERRSRCRPNTYKKTLMMWERFLGQMHKYPWDIRQGEVKAYIAWMQAQGLAPASIKYELNVISSFYKWCSQHPIDAENGEILDPTKGAPGPKVRNYGNAKVLNLEEARALLEVLRMDEAILTKRDYAFFLARLRLGVPLNELQQLKWGQIWAEDRRPGTGDGVEDRGPETEDRQRGGGSKTTPLRGEVERTSRAGLRPRPYKVERRGRRCRGRFMRRLWII